MITRTETITSAGSVATYTQELAPLKKGRRLAFFPQFVRLLPLT
jgi:hypothetical protein